MNRRTSDAKARAAPAQDRFKGDVVEVYVTYELGNRTRVRRVPVPGELMTAVVGHFKNRMGRRVHGVRIQYRQRREPYQRSSGARVGATTLTLFKIVELPDTARNIAFRESLPERFRHILQNAS